MRRFLTIAAILSAITISTLSFVSAEPTAEEQKCFDAINHLRAKYQLPPLMMDETLTEKCREWSRNLERQRKLYHGSTQENCAVGSASGEQTFRQWERSSPHRAFLLSRNITEAGVGNSGRYWTFRAKFRESEAEKQSVTVVKKRNGLRWLLHRAFSLKGGNDVR